MTNIYLISEDFIKSNSGLNDNVFGSYLTSAIREAQDIKLQPILGENLYKKILGMVQNNTINNTENIQYKTLLDEYVQIYLMYQTISDLTPIIGVKLTNLGVVISNDEHLTNLSQSERELVKNYYSQRAEFYGKRLQDFLKNNYSDFPELKGCGCNAINANLESVNESGLWLGGYRSK